MIKYDKIPQISGVLSVATYINRFIRFEQLKIYYTLLIPPNTEYSFLSKAIRPCSPCCWLTWIDPCSFALRVFEEYPLFIQSQKRLPFVPYKQHFTDGLSVFLLSIIQFIWNPFYFFLDLLHCFQSIRNGGPSNS